MKKIATFLLTISLLMTLSVYASDHDNTNNQLLNNNPDIKITFDGLMAVAMGDRDRISIGILQAHHHQPLITINKIEQGKRSVVASLQGVDLQGKSFQVGIQGTGSKQGISIYQSSDMQGDHKDFRWTLDMESDIYQKQLHLQEDKLATKIHINAGQWYANPDERTAKPVKFISNTGQMLPFNRTIAAPACAVSLTDGQSLVISGGKRNIELKSARGVQYEISITNLPPEHMLDIRHFEHYYDVIGSKVTQYEPVQINSATFGPPPMQCGPVDFSKSKLR